MRLRNDYLERLLSAAADLLLKHPWKVVFVYAVLTVISGLITWMWLGLDTNQDNLVSNNLEYHKRYARYLEEFGDQEFIYVVIEGKDLPSSMRIADEVAAELGALKDHIESVYHRLPEDFINKNGLLFLPRPVLEELAAAVEGNRDAVRDLLAIDGLGPLLRYLPAHLDPGAARENPLAAELGLEALKGFLVAIQKTLDGQPAPAPGPEMLAMLSTLPDRKPWSELFVKPPFNKYLDRTLYTQALAQGYFSTGGLLFVQVYPRKDFQTLEVIAEPLVHIREALEKVRRKHPGERIGLTGRPVLSADEMETTNQDMARATVVSMAGIVLLFMLLFREIRRPALAGVVLTVAIGLTFGVVTLTIGHLNLLSIVFAVMLVSNGMEFGIHLIARYQEELELTGSIEQGLRNALLTSGKGNITGATTTAIAFFTALLVDFKGLAELGFIAGTGVMICMVTMNTLLPVILLLTDRWRLPRGKRPPVAMRFLNAAAVFPLRTLALCALLLLAGVPFLREVQFDFNLLHLQAEGLESVEFEQLITSKSDFSTWYSAYMAPTLDDVRRITRDLASKCPPGVIGKIESVLDYIPDDQKEKIATLHRVAEALKDPAASPPRAPDGPEAAGSSGGFDVARVRADFAAVQERLDGLLSGTLVRTGEGAEELEALTGMLDRILDGIDGEPKAAAERLGRLEAAWRKPVEEARRRFLAMLEPKPLAIEGLYRPLRERLRSPNGMYLVYAYPAKDVWEEANMEEFIQATRGVDANVTGVPEQVYESSRIMERGFILSGIYAIVVVFVLIWIDFRNLLFTLLAMVPVAVGMLWLMEIMPLFGMAFNLANFFSIPILIGGGVDGGVHLIHRFREDRSAAIATRSTGTAVVLSFLTNIIGFGSLMIAHHRGIASLGWLMVLGSITCLASSVVALPAILKLVEARRYRKEA